MTAINAHAAGWTVGATAADKADKRVVGRRRRQIES
jgi:hypothetical protein